MKTINQADAMKIRLKNTLHVVNKFLGLRNIYVTFSMKETEHNLWIVVKDSNGISFVFSSDAIIIDGYFPMRDILEFASKEADSSFYEFCKACNIIQGPSADYIYTAMKEIKKAIG